MTDPREILLVITTLPDAESGKRLAHALVENHLAACVNLMPPCQSIYRWQGKTEMSEETMLFIKTSSSRYPALEACIRAHHSYEVPEIIALPLEQGLPIYLDWVTEMSTEETPCA